MNVIAGESLDHNKRRKEHRDSLSARVSEKSESILSVSCVSQATGVACGLHTTNTWNKRVFESA